MNEISNLYGKDFYNFINQGALTSSEIIAPKVMEIFNPKSAIDLGCGTGGWLYTFKSLGVEDIFGVDGSDEGHGLIDNFKLHDFAKPFIPEKRYDLAISLEVAEHIDKQYADIFVESMCRCSDNILWSAAVPGQGGINHVNEQFPSYWIEKFNKLGYSCNGSFRYQFWFDERIENWYRQNILLFSKNIKWTEEVRDLIHYNNYPNYGNRVEDKFKL